MIILNPRLKQRGKRYASTDFYLSNAYSNDSRIVFMVDSGLRMISFPIGFNNFTHCYFCTAKNSTNHFDGFSIRRSLTKVKISFSDSTVVYFNHSTIQNFIK